MNYLILIRHGQSRWNLEKRFTGWADIELTDKGKLEAKKSGSLIKDLDIGINSCFTSYQKRAVSTLEIILENFKEKNINLNKAWQLNERHYGALTGLNKDEIKKKYGDKQVHMWRRSWNVKPPPMEYDHPENPIKNKSYVGIPRNKIPKSESLKDTFERVVPYYEQNIFPLIKKKKNILISAHGNSLRSLCKKILKISNKKIMKFEIPTGNPLVITFREDFKVEKLSYLDKKRAKRLPKIR